MLQTHSFVYSLCFEHLEIRISDLFGASKPGPRPKGGDSEGEFGISNLSEIGVNSH